MTTLASPAPSLEKSRERSGLAGFEVGPLAEGVAFGATVGGLSRADLERPQVRQALFDLWIDKGVILFRGCEDGPEMQIELSRCFGPLEGQVFKETWVDGRPELTRIAYTPEDGNCYEIGGELIGNLLLWHTDQIYSDRLNHGGILRPIKLSQHGGKTGFIDQIAVYEALPDDLKRRIEGLHVVYEIDLNVENAKFIRPKDVRFVRGGAPFRSITRRRFQYPRVLHPMVFEQPETGRKVFNLSPWFAVGVYELGGPDGEALLRDLVARCVDGGQTYFHEWRMGDMVLWDNWRTLHCCPGIPADETRVMHRTTIAGDYALARKLGGGGLEAGFDM